MENNKNIIKERSLIYVDNLDNDIKNLSAYIMCDNGFILDCTEYERELLKHELKLMEELKKTIDEVMKL